MSKRYVKVEYTPDEKLMHTLHRYQRGERGKGGPPSQVGATGSIGVFIVVGIIVAWYLYSVLYL